MFETYRMLGIDRETELIAAARRANTHKPKRRRVRTPYPPARFRIVLRTAIRRVVGV